MGGCASVKRGLCWTQAQASGWSGRKIIGLLIVTEVAWRIFQKGVIGQKNPKDLGIFYCFTSWTQRLTILHATNLSDLGVSKRK